MKPGGAVSYARASYEAMKSHSPFLAEELSKPNNLLGFRYAETILQHHFPMDIHVVHRNMDCNISATTARKELLRGEKRISLLQRGQKKRQNSSSQAAIPIFPAMKMPASSLPAWYQRVIFLKPASFQRGWSTNGSGK